MRSALRLTTCGCVQDLTGFDERQSGRLPNQRQPLDLSYKARSQPSPLRGSGPLGRGVNSLPGSLSGFTPPASPQRSRIRTSGFQDVDLEVLFASYTGTVSLAMRRYQCIKGCDGSSKSIMHGLAAAN